MGFEDFSERELYILIGRRIRATRIKLGLTPQDVIDRTGISRATYYIYESGKASMMLSALHKITNVLGCTLSYLLQSEEEEQALHSIGKLSKSIVDARKALAVAEAGVAEAAASLQAVEEVTTAAERVTGEMRTWQEQVADVKGVGPQTASRKADYRSS